MKIAGAALDDRIDGGPGTAAVLGLVVAEQHLYLGHGIDAWRQVGSGQRAGIEAADAIEREIDGAGARAVNVDANEVVPARGFAIGRVDHTRQELGCAHIRPPLQRQFHHLTGTDQAGALGAFRLNRRGLGTYRDGLRQRAHLQREAGQRDPLVGGDQDVLLLEFLKSRRVYGQGIGAGKQFVENEISLSICLHGTRLAGLAVRDLDSHARHDSSAGIGHRS